MRKELDYFLVADWLDAMATMQQTQFRKLVRVAQKSGITVPAFATGNSTPTIRFDDGGGETDRYERVQHIERVEQFRKEIDQWAAGVKSELKQSIAAHGHGENRNKGQKLADSLTHKIHLDKQYRTEPKSIGFNFARHGVYWAKGARRGAGGLTGSKWTDRYGRLRKTEPTSLGKAGGGVDWFNSVLDRHIPQLANIVASYCGEMTLDLTRIHIL